MPALLSLATTQTPTSAPAAAAASASATSVFGPISEAMAPAPTGTARCMAWPRSLQQARRVGEAERAGGGERGIFAERVAGDEGRAFEIGPRTPSSARAITARLTAISAGWAFSVRVSSSIGPSRMSRDRCWPKSVVDLLEDLARGGEGVGEVGAHADGLAALAGKQEGEAHRARPMLQEARRTRRSGRAGQAPQPHSRSLNAPCEKGGSAQALGLPGGPRREKASRLRRFPGRSHRRPRPRRAAAGRDGPRLHCARPPWPARSSSSR